MKKLIFVSLNALFLQACATAYKDLGDVNSKESYVIECREETQACFDKAEQLCPNGYITKQVSAVGATSLLLFPAQLRTLHVSCK